MLIICRGQWEKQRVVNIVNVYENERVRPKIGWVCDCNERRKSERERTGMQIHDNAKAHEQLLKRIKFKQKAQGLLYSKSRKKNAQAHNNRTTAQLAK